MIDTNVVDCIKLFEAKKNLDDFFRDNPTLTPLNYKVTQLSNTIKCNKPLDIKVQQLMLEKVYSFTSELNRTVKSIKKS